LAMRRHLLVVARHAAHVRRSRVSTTSGRVPHPSVRFVSTDPRAPSSRLVPRSPAVLLPPSEGKAAGGRGRPWAPGRASFPELDDRRLHVATTLAELARSAPDASLAKLLGVKGDALAAAVAADARVLASGTRPAVERYTGVLYDALDAGSLDAAERRRLRKQVAIFSGLWGVVRPGDPLPDYKLKMGATLPGLGVLSTWWRDAVTSALAPVVARRVVWDLLPGEHRAAWAPALPGSPGAPSRILTVRFLDEQALLDGERRFTTVSHWNKLLKGALVRHVLATQLTDPDGLVAFTHPQGYRYDPSLTVEQRGRTELAFVRPAP
jgi:cytoplasmic iron level regulating protein YaaA (DUF328/UPF0246 family)